MNFCCNSAAILREGSVLQGPFPNDFEYRQVLRGATMVVVDVMNDVFQMLIIIRI